MPTRMAISPAANSRLPNQSICACLRTPMSCSMKYAHTVPNTPIGAETRKIRCQFTGARTSAGAVGVVEGAGAGRGVQGREGLRVERVDEPVVVDEPGGDDLLLPGRAGDRAGGGVVPAGLAVGVAVRVVAELAEHPGAQDGAHAGLGPVDLSVRVPAKIFLHLPLQDLDLLVEGGDHR